MALTKPDRDIVDMAAGIKAGAELTIAAGAITLAENAHAVDTQADAASDDLDTINAGPVPDGALVLLFAADGARTVVLKHGAGNIQIQGGSDIALDDANKSVLLRRDGANFRDVAMSAAAGGVVQVVHTRTGAVATGTATVPNDDTIPQNTEGDEYMSLSITPKATTNRLIIDVVIVTAHTVGTAVAFASIFQDAAADALATAVTEYAVALATAVTEYADTPRMKTLTFRHEMAAGTTSPTTFKVRMGSQSAGTTTFNGIGGARRFGGAPVSWPPSLANTDGAMVLFSNHPSCSLLSA